MRSRAVASTVVVLPVAVCSCGSGGGGDGGSGGDGSLRGMLGALPESDEAVTVVYGDLARAAEIAGVEPPADGADEDAAADYLGTITGLRPQDEPAVAAVPLTLGQDVVPQELGEFTDDVGWNPLQVDRFVEARYDGPIPSTVLDGRFDGDGFERATVAAQADRDSTPRNWRPRATTRCRRRRSSPAWARPTTTVRSW